MKTLTILLITVLITMFFSFQNERITCSKVQSNSSEKLQYAGIPPAGKTGAPAESTCFSCHAASLNGPLGNNEIQFNSGINFYKPDSTYTINVSIKEVGSKVFGYEATC